MKNNISLALLASVFSMSVFAGSSAGIKTSGFYAVGGFGYGFVSARSGRSFRSGSGAYYADYDSRDDIAYALSAGYQFNSALGVEAGYMVFPTIKTVPVYYGHHYEWHTSAITVLGRYAYHLAGRASLTAGGGVAVMSRVSKVCGLGTCNAQLEDRSDFYQVVPMFALGADYKMGKKVTLGLEGQITSKAGIYPEMHVAMLNLRYQFF